MGQVIARSERVLLRDRQRDTDLGPWIKWQAEGEWRKWDAPWETLALQPTPERIDRVRQHFLEACDTITEEPRTQAIIATTDGVPIGWMVRYGESRFPDMWSIGIDICEDDHLGKGLGSAALKLWTDYLFQNSTIHRLALATYSFNKRMLRVAEKVGFRHEGTERELVYWGDKWQDRERFAMLRHEWEATLVE